MAALVQCGACREEPRATQPGLQGPNPVLVLLLPLPLPGMQKPLLAWAPPALPPHHHRGPARLPLPCREGIKSLYQQNGPEYIIQAEDIYRIRAEAMSRLGQGLFHGGP